MAIRHKVKVYGAPAKTILADPNTPASTAHFVEQHDVAGLPEKDALVVKRGNRAVILAGTPVKIEPTGQGLGEEDMKTHLKFANDGTANGLIWQEYDVTDTDRNVAVASEGRYLEGKMEIKLTEECKKALPKMTFFAPVKY